jgi:hypothetical protein
MLSYRHLRTGLMAVADESIDHRHLDGVAVGIHGQLQVGGAALNLTQGGQTG